MWCGGSRGKGEFMLSRPIRYVVFFLSGKIQILALLAVIFMKKKNIKILTVNNGFLFFRLWSWDCMRIQCNLLKQLLLPKLWETTSRGSATSIATGNLETMFLRKFKCPLYLLWYHQLFNQSHFRWKVMLEMKRLSWTFFKGLMILPGFWHLPSTALEQV